MHKVNKDVSTKTGTFFYDQSDGCWYCKEFVDTAGAKIVFDLPIRLFSKSSNVVTTGGYSYGKQFYINAKSAYSKGNQVVLRTTRIVGKGFGGNAKYALESFGMALSAAYAEIKYIPWFGSVLRPQIILEGILPC